ncbi:hypothetical protein [Paraburkholderia youngii]|nr:hypothetical protein [Paraburkholderia youngii]
MIRTRSMPGNAHDGHLMEEALDYSAILGDVQPEIVIVDRGCRGRRAGQR